MIPSLVAFNYGLRTNAASTLATICSLVFFWYTLSQRSLNQHAAFTFIFMISGIQIMKSPNWTAMIRPTSAPRQLVQSLCFASCTKGTDTEKRGRCRRSWAWHKFRIIGKREIIAYVEKTFFGSYQLKIILDNWDYDYWYGFSQWLRLSGKWTIVGLLKEQQLLSSCGIVAIIWEGES